MELRVVEADLSDPLHREALVERLDAFVREPVIGGSPLPTPVRAELADRLRDHPTARAWLAFDGARAVGFAIGIVGFSSFAARPVLNVHDLGVERGLRGKGVGRALLEALERAARELGCCKLTLEVRQDNARARRVYDAFGFVAFHPGEDPVPKLFLEKKLASEG
jgi:ribosomal protein S18 acetylase RimI-like enzyme